MSGKENKQDLPRRARKPQSGAASAQETQEVKPSASEADELKVNEVSLDGVEAPSFDYIIPEESYRQHRRRSKRRHRHHHSSAEQKGADSSAKTTDAESVDDFVFDTRHSRRHHHRHRRHRKHSRMQRWKKVLLIIVSVILVLILALAGTYLVLREIGRRSMHQYDDITIVTPEEDESGNDIIAVDKSGRVITYDGVSYAFNDDIIALTMIGVDDGDREEGDLRMADAIYIIAIDAKTGKVKVLGISRDTMTDVDIYSETGKYIDTENRQITYSYAYHGENTTSGENTNKSISRLFFGLPAENYFAINMDALTTLNDAIGGVTLTSSMTFTSPEDGRTIYEGETVTLHGEEAERYVRSRDIEELSSNNDRMKRQQEYIRAFLSSIVPAAKKDLSVVTELYSAVSENSESSLDLPKITYIASTALSKLKSASDIEYVSLMGEITKGANAEMHPTNEQTLRVMLDVFYKPIADVPDIKPVYTPQETTQETAAQTETETTS